MSQQINKNGRLHHFIFFALTTILGMQAMRMLIALLLYVLRDNLGQNATIAGLFAFFVFATSFFIGIMRQRFGLNQMWRHSALLLGPLLLITNLSLRIITPDLPALITVIPLILTMLAVILFLQFLPNYLIHLSHMPASFVLGLLFGLAADTALHGAALTVDFVWNNSIGLSLVIAAQLTLLFLTDQSKLEARSLHINGSWGMMAIGPYILLQMMLFQNIARLHTVSGWSFVWAFMWVLFGHVIGIGTAVTLLKRQTRFIVWLVFSLLLIVSTIGQQSGWLAATQYLAGQVGSAALLTLILTSISVQTSGTSHNRIYTLAYGLGFLLYVIFAFAYYIGYDIPLPFSNIIFPTIIAAIISLLALNKYHHQTVIETIPIHALGLPLVLMALPFYGLISQQTAVPTPGNGYPLRVMTYNIHNGFPPYGNFDLEATAQVIANENADIVALQEVSRGWVINGSIDTLHWLSQRLDMPYIFNPTADPLWGNALLSRYPITNFQLISLPPDNLSLTRGFIAAEIDTGNGQSLHVIATHLHHPGNGSLIRQQQVQAIIDYAQNKPHTVIMGDLNAEPDAPEMLLFRDAGLIDILTDEQPNYTFYSLNPDRQIDYIWLTPDLTADRTTIPTTPASDHLGIATTIRP